MAENDRKAVLEISNNNHESRYREDGATSQ